MAKHALLLHPTKPVVEGSFATPHNCEMNSAADLLRTIGYTVHFQAPQLGWYDLIVVNCYATEPDWSQFGHLKACDTLAFLVNDPAYCLGFADMQKAGIDVHAIYWCGAGNFSKCCSIVAKRLGKEEPSYNGLLLVHFPLWPHMFSTRTKAVPNLSKLCYAGFSRTEYRHKQLAELFDSSVPTMSVGYSVYPGKNHRQIARLQPYESQQLMQSCGATVLVGDEEYTTLGNWAHRLHQAIALNVVCFVPQSMLQCLEGDYGVLRHYTAYGDIAELEQKFEAMRNSSKLYKQCLSAQRAFAHIVHKDAMQYFKELMQLTTA